MWKHWTFWDILTVFRDKDTGVTHPTNSQRVASVCRARDARGASPYPLRVLKLGSFCQLCPVAGQPLAPLLSLCTRTYRYQLSARSHMCVHTCAHAPAVPCKPEVLTLT